MTQEDKELLLKDLCARAMYRPFVQLKCGAYNKPEIRWLTGVDYPDRVYINADSDYYNIEDIKPYLRPMSSMTEEELKEFRACHCVYDLHPDFQPMMCNIANEQNMFDWLNKHHFDYRGLIEKGLALEAPDRMYKT